MTPPYLRITLEFFTGSILFILTILTIESGDLKLLPGIFLIAIYLTAGVVHHKAPYFTFVRFCLGEAGAVSLWLVEPVFGVLVQILVLAQFLTGFSGLHTRMEQGTFIAWCLFTFSIAYLAGQIQHTFFLCLAVLFLAGIGILSVLLAEYRLIYHAEGKDL